MKKISISLALMMGVFISAPAQAQSPLLEEIDRAIPLEEWIGRVNGKTVYYFTEGVYFGREYYYPDSKRARFQHFSGICAEGIWEYVEETEAYCFHWPGSSSCFMHVDREEMTMILPLDYDEEGNIEAQNVGRIVEGAFQCELGLSS